MDTSNFVYTPAKGKPIPPDPFGRIPQSIDSILGLANTAKGKPIPPDPFGLISQPIDLISGLANTDYLVGNGSNNLVEVGKVSNGFALQQSGICNVVQGFQYDQNQLGLSATLQVESLGISQSGQSTLSVWEGQAIASLKGINSSQISVTNFVSP
jgi:hypothetical protein